MSAAEDLLAAQLDQAGISYQREYRFHPERRWRADFATGDRWTVRNSNGKEVELNGYAPLLIEVDGGGFVQGRHAQGPGIEKDAEKQSAAAILGYRVIRCTPRQVNSGTALDWIKQALGLERNAAA